jgi:D-amino-acid dehydrogenase
MRIAVIGTGGVGLSCAFHLARDGHDITVFDPDPDGDKCSWGNAGGIAVTDVVPASVPGALWKLPGWMFDPLGPLSLSPAHAPRMVPWFLAFIRAGRPRPMAAITTAMAALLGRVYDDLAPMLDALGLASRLHRDGALTVYESQDAYRGDQAEWDLKRQHGIVCEPLTAAQAREMEPALGPSIGAAVFTPAWSTVSDPKEIWAALLASLRARGIAFVAQRVLALPQSGTVQVASGAIAGFDRIVVAAGAWSGSLAAGIGDRVLLESERGYNRTIPAPGITLNRQVIFAERKFVATPLSIGLRIGGAASFAGLTAPPNYARSRTLATLAQRYLPALSIEGGTDWMGQRPATPDTLPVVGPSPRRADVVYAFGHGHLGLTLSATSGALVADHIAGRAPAVDLAPLSIARF